MKFALAPLAFAAAAFAAPAALETRQTGWCVISNKVLSYGTTERFLYNLIQACSNNSDVVDSGDLWSNKVCVAAAMAAPTGKPYVNPDVVVGVSSCKNPEGITDTKALPNLNYNVYAGIVGDCAWQEGGCPITQQNAIDLVYSALSDIGSQEWPSSAGVVADGFKTILDWAKTGDTVPYTNFNDYLHYYF